MLPETSRSPLTFMRYGDKFYAELYCSNTNIQISLPSCSWISNIVLSQTVGPSCYILALLAVALQMSPSHAWIHAFLSSHTPTCPQTTPGTHPFWTRGPMLIGKGHGSFHSSGEGKSNTESLSLSLRPFLPGIRKKTIRRKIAVGIHLSQNVWGWHWTVGEL